MIIQEPVQAAIWHCLNHYAHKDAVFLAERLCLEIETDDTVFMLATSYYRSRQLHQAYWLLKEKSRRSPQCRFLHARCAFELKKYAEAESALTSNNFGDMKHFDEITKEFGEIACFVLQLIAQICLKTERTKIASDALRKALKLNPFLWQAYADLCRMGEDVDPSAIFQITSTDVFNTCQGNSNASSIIFGHVAPFNDASNLTMNNLSSMLSTPVDQQYNYHLMLQQQLPNTPTQLQAQPQATPVSSYSLSNSMSILRGGAGGGVGGGGGGGCNISGIYSNNLGNAHNASDAMDTTPVMYGGNNKNSSGAAGDSLISSENSTETAGTPFRKQFKYLSAFSPNTPSFGFLPVGTPSNNGDSPLFGYANAGQINITNTPSPQTLNEINQEQKVIGKKMKSGHSNAGSMGSGHVINRKDSNSSSKPTVFSQTGNITPRSPSANGANSGAAISNAAVRRSSRLFSNNAYSVKENNKTPNISMKFAQPRSPPRKTKMRMAKICLNNELFEEKTTNANSTGDKLCENVLKKDHKEKIETITSATTGTTMTTTTATGNNNNNNSNSNRNSFNNNNNNNNNSSSYNSNSNANANNNIFNNNSSSNSNNCFEESKVLLNNSLNNAQTITHYVLNLKKQSAEGLMNLLRDLGEGFKRLANYECKAAIDYLEATIPKHHLCSSWVQSLIGMSHYELREYEAAVSVFKRIHESEPYRLDYMDIYSSSLWHLQKEVDLSALSQDLVNQDRLSPITWCVAGNCFSLHKEHETAIKFFKRAVQVDPDYIYSYTLLGHELMLTEELDKALDYFRTAVVRDPRHYNAWFGIGTIYSKQEKYELAELHYFKALKINPLNSVILVHVGAMQYFMQRKELALQTLNMATQVDPKNPLARFHRGSIYFSLGRHQDALRELEELKEIVPKESVVFYLIGKIHKTLGNVDLALMHFSWATDLDPKGANNQIRDAFDSMSHPGCCTSGINDIQDTDLVEQISERSDYSTQTPHDINYDSDF